MPTSLHPQAKFDPIPPDLDLYGLVDRTPNFKWVQRVSRSQVLGLGQQGFEKLIQIHVIAGGKPLVIDGWDALLPEELFNVNWLEKTYDKKEENVRDVTAGTDIPMTTGHYLRSMKQLTNQWTPQNFRDERRQRLYLKDIDCPVEWRYELQTILHPNLFYLNDNVTKSGSSNPTRRPGGDGQHGENSIAPAGDLMSSLPEEMRAENLMCYVGHEGTYTPAHREMCASVGHNIMVETSGDSPGERPGSSIWFMTESKDRDVVREYFLSMLGHDIEIEKHFAQINAWKKAPFDVYLVDQRAGDFIIIPPLAAHQVWNRGTRTMKVAWNRTTPETLRLALREALPKARLVCRDEQYKNKAIIYFTLHKYYQLLKEMERQEDITQNSFMGIGRDIVRNSPRARQLAGDFRSLFSLFTEILIDEAFAYNEKQVERLPFDSCVTCSYCRCNIFNRFLTCKNCTRVLVNGDEDAYDICMECYAMGRSCACLSGLQWCEQWSWSELSGKYELWREMVIVNDGFVDLHSSPPPFETARQKSAKKSVAQICQEALIRRPWKDITKQDVGKVASDSEQGDVEDEPKKKTKRKQKKGEVRRCHVCCHKDYSYRVHECSNSECAEAYCYGVLYRAFDMMPQAVLQNETWQCPKCLGICNCGYCRRAGNTNPYTPKNTSLGHDTRPIADDRSVEALVDFRVHNLSWLKAAGEESRSRDSRRMQILRQQADHAKARSELAEVESERALLGDRDNSQRATNTDPEGRDPERQSAHEYPTLALESGNSSRPRSDSAGPLVAHDGISPYPDPSVASNYGIGMGYYEQDDTPDKILFDPYKAPSPSAIHLADLEVPDSVKKSIRAAKRKAKRENEDPDFIVGRSSHKRTRHTNGVDILDNLDPALFDVEPSTASSTLRQRRVPSSNTIRHLAENQDGNLETLSTEPLTETMPTEPTLRHARPLASYVEVDDVDMDEVEEGEMVGEGSGQEAVLDDKAAEAIEEARLSEVQNSGLQQEASVTSKHLESTQGRKSRVRPLQVSLRSVDSVSMTDPISPRPAIRRRGRPRKSTVVSLKQSDTAADGTAGALRDQGESLGEAPDTSNVRSSNYQQLKSNSSIGASLQQHEEPSVRSVATVEISQERNLKDVGRELRSNPRGRESQPEAKNPASQVRNLKSASQSFMSMAERLALKGRKFKIGKRRAAASPLLKDKDGGSHVSEASESTIRESRQVLSAVAGRTEGSYRHQSQSRPGPRTSSAAAGPLTNLSDDEQESVSKSSDISTTQKTVVRLTDMVSSEDEHGSTIDMAVSSSDDSGDSDIPASGMNSRERASTELGYTQYRGGRRGGGRGRGRRRGRPRGSGRGTIS
ncbi:JmjC and zinc-finger of monoamine-oxidase A repressor R1 domain protein [Metarhizium robertsii]|uniref:JmjC and zinc-finger of monoamine-oxidase A repressor R1 domain protein n=1 Tax=Metarhizium robertsii TaxID=568076 RepID=A0A014PSN6_9HYPO|nr:JmjC and zinc-finger of monoamine-oxidase A repressor R1 domain protein [Metarhizium robertsii]